MDHPSSHVHGILLLVSNIYDMHGQSVYHHSTFLGLLILKHWHDCWGSHYVEESQTVEASVTQP